MNELWDSIKDIIYLYEDKWAKLGFPPKEGFSGYYSANLT
jgi:hypothetical protein